MKYHFTIHKQISLKFFWSLCLNFLIFSAFSQSRLISGKVTSLDGKLLEGVNIRIKNANTGTITDLQGMYKISVPENTDARLIYSMVGYSNTV